jgi:hypothetical protein
MIIMLLQERPLVLVVVTQIQAFVFICCKLCVHLESSPEVTESHRERQKEREFKPVLCSYNFELVKNRRFPFFSLTVHNQEEPWVSACFGNPLERTCGCIS